MGWIKTGLTAVGSAWGPAGAAVGNGLGSLIDGDGGGGGGSGTASGATGGPGFGFGNEANYQYGSTPIDADWAVSRARNLGGSGETVGAQANQNQQTIGNQAQQAGNQAWWNQAGIGQAAAGNALAGQGNQQAIGNRTAQIGGEIRRDTGYQAGAAQGRDAAQGNFGQQNGALARAGTLGSQTAKLNTSLAAGQAETQAANLSSLEQRQGPSAAQAQLQSANNQAAASQLALARSGRGFGGNAAAQGLAQGNLAGLNANAANQSAQLRAQEDAAWRGRQAQNLQAAGGLNLNLNAQRAQNLQAAAGNQLAIGGQQGQQAQANLQAQQQQRGLNDARSLGLTQVGAQSALQAQQQQQQAYQAGGAQALQGYGLQSQTEQAGAAQALQGLGQQSQAFNAGAGTQLAGLGLGLQAENTANAIRGTQQAGELAREDNAIRAWAAQNDYSLGQSQVDAQKEAAYINAIASLGSTAAAASSDIRAKKNITGDSQAGTQFARSLGVPERAQYDRDALDAAAAAQGAYYDYKDPGAPGADDRTHYGPMAQDLAKTPAGATTVVKQPDGKLGVDTGRLALVNTSAISAQQQQLDDIQQQLAQFAQQPGADYPLYSYGSFPDEAGY